MRRTIYGLLTALLLAASLSIAAGPEPARSEGGTVVIPIHGMIERGLLYVVRRGLAQAQADAASLVILDMHTPGGSVQVTEEIIRLLIDLPAGVSTCTFVNKDALSAGALIAMATDDIYMAPGSRLGASAVVTLFGDIPEGDMKEKVVSSLVALVSDAAQRKGHDPALVRAMIRKEEGYAIGNDVICEEGKLLTLTELDATRIVGEGEKVRPLLASGTASTLDDLLKVLGRSGDDVRTLRVTAAEKLARWVETLGVLFLVAGLIGLYIEFKVPGFGLPGIIGLACLAIFFWGHLVAGLAGMEEVLLFLVGLLLLAAEVFVIPGFGVAGVSGISLMVASIVMAMVQHTPGGSLVPPAGQLQTAALNASLALVLTFVLAVVLGHLLPRSTVFGRVALGAAVDRQHGFVSAPDEQGLVGLAGVAECDLRPAGIGVFGDRRLDVVTGGTFVGKGTPIRVVESHGQHIVVAPAPPGEKA